jgi:hypothetical protein
VAVQVAVVLVGTQEQLLAVLELLVKAMLVDKVVLLKTVVAAAVLALLVETALAIIQAQALVVLGFSG